MRVWKDKKMSGAPRKLETVFEKYIPLEIVQQFPIPR